jgi:hypothetical protein
MSTSETIEMPAAPEPRNGRSVALLIAAAVLVVAVVAAVLLLGVVRPPQLVAVTAEPTPALPGAVAWTSWERGSGCLHVARPDGSSDEVWCDRSGGEAVGWSEAGYVLVSHYDGAGRLLEIDPATGEVVSATRIEEPWQERPLAAGVVAYHDDGELVVELETGGQVWRVDAPATYGIRTSARSPDGGWVAMVDEAGRLLVVPSDGSAPPRVWVADGLGWGPVVWQGGSASE